MGMTKEQFKRLPKFAQEEIERLSRNLKTCHEDLTAALGTWPEGDTQVRIDYEREFCLPNHTRVVFTGKDYTGKPNGLKVCVHTHPDGHINVEFDDGVIIPSARNVIYIVDNKNVRGR